MHREWIFRLGRLDALGRVAHFFAETRRRLEMVGLVEGAAFALPMQQAGLASACGITVLDLPRLYQIAEFDDAYLYPSPR